jgi:phosphoribosyl-AMP cyclohydrolase
MKNLEIICAVTAGRRYWVNGPKVAGGTASREPERVPIHRGSVNHAMVEPDFKKGGGLVPVIVQDFQTGEVLMLAYINGEAWKKTLETGKATYWSRSRNTLWVKGETSGHFQIIREIRVDCDDDTVLFMVEQVGEAACHTGHRSCFYRKVTGDGVEIIGKPVKNPEDIYK